MDIRTTIDLLESKNKEELKQIKLPYSHTALAPVMSSAELDLHYGKLYKGYVDRYNAGEGDSTFNEAGAYLHGIYFGQFRSPGTRQPTGIIKNIIDKNHKSYSDFKDKFKEQALKLQGAGWVYLSRSGVIKTIHNHAKRTDIALLLDMWEHAYLHDYGSNKSKYIDGFWRIIDWDRVNHRL